MNLIILGPQGCGKGTQAEKLAQEFDLENIDMGKFLREVASTDTPTGKEVYRIQNVTKTLVPSRILREVLHLKLGSIPREKGIVFDGVPRTLDQAEYVEDAMLEFGRKLDRVIFINITAEESYRRISTRRICENCKKGYIMGKDIHSEEKLCQECGGKIIQRIDDTREGVEKRLKVFKEETMPVIEYFREKGLVLEVDGEKNPKEVYKDILESIKYIAND